MSFNFFLWSRTFQDLLNNENQQELLQRAKSDNQLEITQAKLSVRNNQWSITKVLLIIRFNLLEAVQEPYILSYFVLAS